MPTSSPRYRFGIGEWYGKPFVELNDEERLLFANRQKQKKADRTPLLCPFLSNASSEVLCRKDADGGVCTLRRYQLEEGASTPEVAAEGGGLRTTCPSRFEQGGWIYGWIGEVVLGDATPARVSQVDFLQRVIPAADLVDQTRPRRSAAVGRIDDILAIAQTDPLVWCAVEMQAVYFSGDSMEREFEEIVRVDGQFSFPAGQRRPDYRSSGPKRLMPQLQIKVPTLRRWGKKMAVVVDEYFFDAMGDMKITDHISNCDVAWFIVGYDDKHEIYGREVRFTTLEESVEGLVSGKPVTLPEFDQRLRRRLSDWHASPG